MHTYIGVAVAVAVFIFFFFGNRVFPHLFVFDLFQAGIFNAQHAARQVSDGRGFDAGAGDIPSNVTLGSDVSALASIFSDLSEPVSSLDLKEGTGIEAVELSTVSIGYQGTYIDEETGEAIVFDENTDRAASFVFTIDSGQVIPGFDIGVTGMREGGIRFVTIKPEMGYGNRQVGPIPPNTTLHFLIELYEVRQ